MNTLKSLAATGLLCGGMVLGMETASVLATDFKTTFTLENAIGSPAVNTMIFNWSTNLTSGTVTENDLTNWSYELLNSGSSVYTETVIAGGVVQPIGGVSRNLSDLLFNFDLDTLTATIWSNDLNYVQSGAATGVTYNVFPYVGGVRLVRLNNGSEVSDDISSFSQSTIEVTPSATTPEPSSLLGLLAVSSLGLLARKRKI